MSEKTIDLFCPRHGRTSRPIEVPGLRCDCIGGPSWPSEDPAVVELAMRSREWRDMRAVNPGLAEIAGPIPANHSVLTVYLSDKWYGLVLVRPPGITYILDFGRLEEYVNADESAFVDHVPNPRAVVRLAEARGLHLVPRALELIVGRWELEARHRYDDLHEVGKACEWCGFLTCAGDCTDAYPGSVDEQLTALGRDLEVRRKGSAEVGEFMGVLLDNKTRGAS